ncbi:cytochrome oxidase I [Halobiforma lacisalsi AJ5]|uniref:Cytochrome oxidase I n=1 Tax=Natronobacterium lacisalsi AJ5 TaxID=358396 RepID=M0LRD0_NATLA|nr:XdhC/CoxI family protein [Halobiforma lacisalsi]APW96897.1 cytochrome oxidase I [Halobiforma lacisalsi AJ5]EMA34605.1 xanthine and Co dehydrogenase maturation factor [Halobiforma lacisalsi AJ5]
MIDSEPTDPWGVPRLELFERLERSLEGDGERAVATVVGVDGSAYRRPGAKMLLGSDGSTYGGITAGCLEGPLREVAGEVLADGSPTVVTFDLTDDDDGWGLGLGCEGVVDVLVEPVDDSWSDPVEAFGAGERRATVTVVDGTDSLPVGARTTVPAEGEPIDPDDRPAVPENVLEAVLADARERAADGRWERRTVATDGGDVDLFVDGIEPVKRLLVFGGQPDVRPVTRLAREVGLEVTVATARGAQADESSFPRADRVVATHPSDLGDLVDDRTFVVVMSHNLLDDRLALEALLSTPAPFIGLMGPRERFERLRDDLQEESVTLTDEDRDRIASPVGLDLGGGEPVEIALSIVSEVLAVSNDREGGRLRDRAGPIHERSPSEPSEPSPPSD